MNEQKHTPGPWRIVGFAAPGGFGIYSGAIPNAGHYVAEVKSTYLDAHRQGEGDANARLIASSPRLLAACYAALASPPMLRGAIDRTAEENELHETLWAAICEATGEGEK